MNHSTLRDLHDTAQLFGRDCPQAMRSHTNGSARQAAYGTPARFNDARKAFDVVDEASLAHGRGGASETTVGIKRRQEGEPDPRLRRRCGDPASELARI